MPVRLGAEVPRLHACATHVLLGCLASAGLAAVVVAQQNPVHPQPRAERLPSPSAATANSNRRVPQPDGTLPTVPAGFSVASYAELRAPRVMVYAPNGDLFVSSPATNSITVLRDANNDGVFEARERLRRQHDGAVSATRAGACRRKRAAGTGPWCTSKVHRRSWPTRRPGRRPPDYGRRGQGGLRLPFGLAFNNGYLYVGNTDSLVRYKYSERRPEGAGRAGEAAGPAHRRALDTQHRVQPRRDEDVHRRRLAIEQRRRRGLPPRRHSRVQSGRQRVLASTRRASATPLDWRCSPARTPSGRR